MKKILALAVIACFTCTAFAQTGNSDSTSRHPRMQRNWMRNSGDSSHKRDMRSFGRGGERGEAMNRFNQRPGGMQGPRSFNRRGDDRMRPGRPHIRYSPEQRKQLMAINTEYRKKAADLYKRDEITLREYKSQLLALQKEKKNKEQDLLTPEQKQQIAGQRKKAEEEMQVRAAAHLERMKIRLKLNDDQAAKIKSQQVAFRSQMKSIHANDNLEPREKMEQMKALAIKQKDAIKSVLSPDQLQEFEKMHRPGFGRK